MEVRPGLVEVRAGRQVAQPAVGDRDDARGRASAPTPLEPDVDADLERQREQAPGTDAEELNLHRGPASARHLGCEPVPQIGPDARQALAPLLGGQSPGALVLEREELSGPHALRFVEVEGFECRGPQRGQMGLGVDALARVDGQLERRAARVHPHRFARLEAGRALADALADLPPQRLHLVEPDAEALVLLGEIEQTPRARVDVRVRAEQEERQCVWEVRLDLPRRRAWPVGRVAQVVVAERRRVAAVLVDDGERAARLAVDARDGHAGVDLRVGPPAVAADPGLAAAERQPGGHGRRHGGGGGALRGRGQRRPLGRGLGTGEGREDARVRARVGVDAAHQHLGHREPVCLGDALAQRARLGHGDETQVELDEQCASAALGDLVRWLIEATTAGWDEMSRRDQRLALRTHWLGEAFKSFERGVLLPTGLILGLPIAFAFGISFLTLHKKIRWLNWALTGLSTAVLVFWIVNLFAVDAGLLPGAQPIDFVLFPVATLLTLYLTWRFFGGFIVGFCIFWIVYFFVRGLLPEWTGILSGSESTFGQSMRSMVLNFWSQTGGMFGQPLQVVSGNVLIFIVFGAVLMASGAGSLLMKIANRLTGGLTGGAAHAAVASSALFGTLSGAAISNVVSTGVMTIPVIKKSGFRPAFAGAVEAAASTGGQIMPPVMGVVAFFVAGQIGLEYRYIVIAAIVPAAFYYLGTFLTVYFEARRLGIGPLPREVRPSLNAGELVQCLVFVLPLGTLSYFLFVQPSVPKAGFFGFIVAFACSLILFSGFRSWSKVYKAFVDAGRMSAAIIVIVAAIGLIVGLIQVSGFSGRLSLLLTQLASGPLWTTLVVVALGSIVLGMGLPPGATYFIIVIALSSGIEAVGIPPLTLHLFVVFFAVISTVTPPVALAAFAAAPIAGADPIRTGLQAARLSLAGFIIPFVFVYHPAVLYKLQVLFVWFGGKLPTSKAMMDVSLVSWFDLGWVVMAFSVSMWLLSSAITGFEKNRLNGVERLLRVVAGCAVLVPDLRIAVPGLVLAIALIVGHRFLKGEPSAVDVSSA